jgi:hypothetical protein
MEFDFNQGLGLDGVARKLFHRQLFHANLLTMALILPKCVLTLESDSRCSDL